MTEQWAWDRKQIKLVDESLCNFLESLCNLQLITKDTFELALICDTKLLEEELYWDDYDDTSNY